MPASVFAIFADVTPLPNASYGPEISDGRFVYCYLMASDEDGAREILRLDLEKRGLQLDNIQWCVNHDENELLRVDREEEDPSVVKARTEVVVYDRIEPMFSGEHEALPGL